VVTQTVEIEVLFNSREFIDNDDEAQELAAVTEAFDDLTKITRSTYTDLVKRDSKYCSAQFQVPEDIADAFINFVRGMTVLEIE
jgi:hypothetical protein